jgi:hypothetical protein
MFSNQNRYGRITSNDALANMAVVAIGLAYIGVIDPFSKNPFEIHDFAQNALMAAGSLSASYCLISRIQDNHKRRMLNQEENTLSLFHRELKNTYEDVGSYKDATGQALKKLDKNISSIPHNPYIDTNDYVKRDAAVTSEFPELYDQETEGAKLFLESNPNNQEVIELAEYIINHRVR